MDYFEPPDYKVILLLLALITLLIDLLHYKHLQTIFRLHKKTLFFLLPFIFGLWWAHVAYSLDSGSTLTFASVLLVILFFLLTKTEADTSKAKSIEATHTYNFNVAKDIVTSFSDVGVRAHNFMSTLYTVDIYRNYNDYIYQTKGVVKGDAMIFLIAEIEKSNSLIKITQQMQIKGIQGPKQRAFLGETNTNLYEIAKRITMIIGDYNTK